MTHTLLKLVQMLMLLLSVFVPMLLMNFFLTMIIKYFFALRFEFFKQKIYISKPKLIFFSLLGYVINFLAQMLQCTESLFLMFALPEIENYLKKFSLLP